MAESTKQKLTGKQWIILITLILMYFFAPTFNAVSSTLSLMPDYYGVSAATVSWINVIANPSAAVMGLVIGLIAGRKVSYKICCTVAMFLFGFFGGLPFLWQGMPFGVLLVSRFLFGIGMGCINPLVIAIVSKMFKNETTRSAWIGAINIVFSIGATLGTTITGALSLDGVWQNAYSFYLFALIPCIMAAIFINQRDLFNEDEREAEPTAKDAKPVEKRHIPGVSIAFIILFGLSLISCQSFFGYAGIAMGESGANTLLIGTVFSVFTIAGIVAAAANTILWRAFRLWNMPIAFALFSLCYVFCIIGTNTGSTAMFFAASITCGLGTCMVGMCIPMILSITVSAASLGLAIGLEELARNLGGTLSAPWLQAIGGIFGDTAMIQFKAILIYSIIGIVLSAILAVKYGKQFSKEALAEKAAEKEAEEQAA